jgi:hypothetical protein
MDKWCWFEWNLEDEYPHNCYLEKHNDEAVHVCICGESKDMKEQPFKVNKIERRIINMLNVSYIPRDSYHLSVRQCSHLLADVNMWKVQAYNIIETPMNDPLFEAMANFGNKLYSFLYSKGVEVE